MMSFCQHISVYEFLPSERRSERCHYYERYEDAACSLGAFHPLLYEKLLVQKLKQPTREEPEGTKEELRTRGKVSLRGFSNIHCRN